jgi:hypothetical protein
MDDLLFVLGGGILSLGAIVDGFLVCVGVVRLIGHAATVGDLADAKAR